LVEIFSKIEYSQSHAGVAQGPARHRLSVAMAGGLEYFYYIIMLFYTYVLKSEQDNKLYIGWTNDLQNRLKEHNAGRVTATKNRRPLALEYFEACKDKKKAIAREKYFKTGFGRNFLKNRI